MSTTMPPRRTVFEGSAGTSPLRRKLEKKRAELKSLGVGGVLRKLFRDHVYRVREYAILENWLEPGAPMPKDPSDLMVVESGDPMPDFRRHFAEQADDFEKTLRQGCFAFIATKDGAPIAVAFGSLKDYYGDVERCWFRVGDGEAYLFKWLVPPGQRSFGVVSRLVKFSNAYLAARGYRRTWCVVETWNAPSAASLLYLGYQEAREMLRAHRLLRWHWSSREPYTELRFARYQRKRARS